MKSQLRVSVLLVASVALLISSFACKSSANDASARNACTPFGDPSAAVFSAPTPSCGSGKLLGPWKDYDGMDRYACLYLPKGATKDSKLPMVVYLHPSLFSAGWITQTNLLDYQNSVSLNDDPKRTGYIVLAPEGRETTHYYPFPDNKGIGWDNWYRQLNPDGDVPIGNTVFKENVDALAIDHFIADQVAAGAVDTNRIYLSGWSNGAAMAILYGLNRPKIAAAAVYSAPDPFGALDDPCPQTPVAAHPTSNAQVQIFNPHLPTMHVRNSCDISGICPNGLRLASELRAVGAEVEDVLLDFNRERATACDDSCGTNPNGQSSGWSNPIRSSEGTINHARWPKSWTTKMLDFFRDHPLKASP
jgi:hypothetical protein